MIDFLNLKPNNNSCECLKTGYSIQLLPYEYNPYVLYIGNEDFIFLDSIDILNQYGEIINIFTDLDDFEHEGYVFLSNLSYDDVNNIVLKFTLRNTLNETRVLYSDEIKISSYNSCKTTRINFKCKENDQMQSIQFPIWEWQHSRNVELESVYQISTKTQISYPTSNAKYVVYQSELMSIDTICKLSDALQKTFVYFNYKRVNLFDAIEIPERTSDENFGQTRINVCFYKGLGNNDITPVNRLITEVNNDYIITENNNNIITEK